MNWQVESQRKFLLPHTKAEETAIRRWLSTLPLNKKCLLAKRVALSTEPFRHNSRFDQGIALHIYMKALDHAKPAVRNFASLIKDVVCGERRRVLCKERTGEVRMASLQVKLLHKSAKVPTVTHPAEDIGYDLYAVEDLILNPGQVYRVPTGVAVAGEAEGSPVGFLVKDRSSMAAKGVFSHGGVIDSSYRGEIVVLMSTVTADYEIHAGDRIAQLVPTPVLTGPVSVASELATGTRGSRGFGSSGR